MGKQRFAGTSRADKQNVALGQFHFAGILGGVTESLVVVVDRHGENALGDFLADDILVKDRADLTRCRQVGTTSLGGFFRKFVTDDVVAE